MELRTSKRRSLRRSPVPGCSELSVFECAGYREYRLKNAKVTNGLLPGVLLAAFLSLCWQNLSGNKAMVATIFCAIIVTRTLFFQVIYESVILLPPHGLQLEAHYGIPGICSLGAEKRFIPAHRMDNVIIHEGLSGWNVLYYLAIIKMGESPGTRAQLEVAFEDILPPHPVLLEVYTGIHEILIPQPPKTSGLNIDLDAKQDLEQ